jgi:mono/diheme cytochrome c family protein
MARTRLALVLLLALAALALVTAGCGGDDDSGSAEPPAATTTDETTTDDTTTDAEESETGDAANGEQVFASAGCGGCHTLAAAGSSGTVGPNLDEAAPSFGMVVGMVTNGGGAMPSFSDKLSEDEIRDVAAFVSGA